MTCFITVVAQDRDLSELDLHHPPEIDGEPSIHDEDVVLALVVRHDDIRSVFIDIRFVYDRNEHRGNEAVEPCPYFAGDLHEPLACNEEKYKYENEYD